MTSSLRLPNRVTTSALCCLAGLLVLNAPAAHAEPAAQQFRHDALTGLEFAYMPPGCFTMGAAVPGQVLPKGMPMPPRADEVPQHEVCVDGFWLARTEVTTRLWQHFMPDHPARTATLASLPATGIAIDDAERFLLRLNARAGASVYRLPTEAEWEYACQPGEPVTGSFDDQHGPREQELRAMAHFRDIRRDDPEVAAVATRKENPFGLFDMLGNVWEWTSDNYAADAYRRHPRQNPRHSDDSRRWVMRGGSFKTDLYQTRCGARAWGVPGDRLPSVGMRLLHSGMSPPEKR